MTEYLISDELLTSIRRACYNAGKAGKGAFTVKAPSIEVVRCRDCKFFDRDQVACDRWDTVFPCPTLSDEGQGFCWWGERREDA